MYDFPTTIRVDIFDYRLVSFPADSTRDHDGAFDPRPGFECIWIREGLTCVRLLTVLKHEILHAISWAKDLDDSSSEEDFVDQASKGLIGFELDNPEFLRWWNRKLAQLRRRRNR